MLNYKFGVVSYMYSFYVLVSYAHYMPITVGVIMLTEFFPNL